VSRKAQNNVTLLGGRSTGRSSHKPGLPYGAIARRRDLTVTTARRLTVDHGFRKFDVESRNRLQTT
jgi:hypothetical protein